MLLIYLYFKETRTTRDIVKRAKNFDTKEITTLTAKNVLIDADLGNFDIAIPKSFNLKNGNLKDKNIGMVTKID